MITVQKLLKKSDFPSYKLFPWEQQEIEKYAYDSVQNYVNNGVIKQRDPDYIDLKVKRAMIGIAGEYGFFEMLKKHNQERVIEWPAKAQVYGSSYDFLLEWGGRKFTVDIKTTEKSERVFSPDQCNFVWSLPTSNMKREKDIAFCNYYIQMFYDREEGKVYFIGAVDYPTIMAYENKEKIWYKRTSPATGVIAREHMNLTEEFIRFFTEGYTKEIDFDTVRSDVHEGQNNV
jgi:hypothetical protein